MSSIKTLKSQLDEIEKKLGIRFKSPTNLIHAFIHPSYLNENRSPKLQSYERLEFLGDSILGVLISRWLYHFFPEAPEGDLSWMRASLVDAPSCAMYLKGIGLDSYVLTSKGEENNQGKGRDTILADVFEAILAAIYLDSGMSGVLDFFGQRMEKALELRVHSLQKNAKIVLQNYIQKLDGSIPRYEVVKEQGPEHEKLFIIAVFHRHQELGRGSGQSKKQAQIEAAKKAINKLGIKDEKDK